MSRLDRHLGAVRTRMVLSLWLRALAWAAIAYAIVVWAAIVVDRLAHLHLPRQMLWFWIGCGVTVALSLAYALWRRPNQQQAAVAIDEKLLLKEKFSTALYVRPSKDPFAMAAIYDAEKTAEKVNLHNQFPVQVPRAAGGTAAAMTVVFLTALFLPQFDLFGVQSRAQAKAASVETERTQAREVVRKAIAEIEAAPKAIADKPQIQLAKKELLAMRNKPDVDSERARSTAQKAVQDVQQAIKDRIKQNQNYAITQEEMREFKNMAPPSDQTGPIADAHRALAQGKFDQAVEDLEKAVNKFDKMDAAEQKKAAEQMKNLAQAINKMASDPKVQQQMQQNLQQMGANQQQMQQAMNLMKQAAAGDKQAQQQLNNMAKQLAQQMNQNGNQSPQQQRKNAQQVAQMMKQMQQMMNTQINAQQLAQNAQGLAQAMQQAAQSGSPGQPKPAAQGQASNKGQQQQGKGQQMANAAKQMQQQLQQMQAVANDAQQVAAGQNGADDGSEGKDGNGKNGWGQNPQQGPGQNNPNAPANGLGGGVAGAGNNRPRPEVAPFQVKEETDTSEKNEKGKILARTFVKAGSIKGDAKMELHDVLPSVDKDATDEIDEQRIPRQDAAVVRDYFGNLKKDAEK